MTNVTLVEALQEAISKEQEDVAMYEALLKLVPESRGDMSRAIRGIMDNEKRHATVLRSFLPQQ